MTKFYKKWQFFAFVLPIFVLYTAFTIVPVFVDFYNGFTDWHGAGQPNFIGFANYAKMLKDKYLLIAFRNTLKITLTCLVVLLPTSFFIAFTLNRQCRTNNAIKTAIFAPYIISTALTGLIWIFILNPSTGLINNFLEAIGLGALKQQWINGKVLSPYSFGVVGSWAGMGFYVSLWQVGLRSISTDILEASLIDGASKWQMVKSVILPMLRGTLTTILVFIVTGALKTYELVAIITDGGPVRASESIVSYMYTTMFTNAQYGYGMAVAVVEFIIAIAATIAIRAISNAKKG